MNDSSSHHDLRLREHVRALVTASDNSEATLPDAVEELMEHALEIVDEMEARGMDRGCAVAEAIRRLGAPPAVRAAFCLEGTRSAFRKALALPAFIGAAALADVIVAAGLTVRDAPVAWTAGTIVTKLIAVGIVAVTANACLLILAAFAWNLLREPAVALGTGTRLRAASLAGFTVAAWLAILPGETSILAFQAIDPMVQVPWSSVALAAAIVTVVATGASFWRLPYRIL